MEQRGSGGTGRKEGRENWVRNVKERKKWDKNEHIVFIKGVTEHKSSGTHWEDEARQRKWEGEREGNGE